ncbi:MAG: protein kinase, partial [Pirellulaceae bacterium]
MRKRLLIDGCLQSEIDEVFRQFENPQSENPALTLADDPTATCSPYSTFDGSNSFLENEAEFVLRTHGEDSSTDERSTNEVLAGGRFQLRELFAQGGLSRVWIARDQTLNRSVALKEIRPDLLKSAVAKKRFQHEAQITGQLEHPHIVPIYELGPDPNGNADQFYVMKFVKGETLRSACNDYHRNRLAGDSRPLEMLRLLQSFVGVCQAIAYAHSRGVIHRDIKPENVVLGKFGEVIVLDWGLAKLTSRGQGQNMPDDSDSGQIVIDESRRSDESIAGAALGTPAYMAPEQANSELGTVDERSDIYCLGSTLFMILTGKTPHFGSTIKETLVDVLANPAPHARSLNSRVPPPLDAICAKAMEYDKSARYLTVSELTLDIQRFLADEPVSVYKYPFRTRVQRWVKRNRAIVASAIALLVTTTIALAVGNLLLQNEQTRTEIARRNAEQLATEMTLDHGLLLCKNGQVGPGLLWLNRALEMLPAEDLSRERFVRSLISSWQQDQYKVKSVIRAGSGVNAVQFSHDARYLLTAGNHDGARIWDCETSKQQGDSIAHESAVTNAEFGASGNILTIESSQKIRVWDRTSRSAIGPFSLDDQLTVSAYSETANRVYAGGQNGSGSLWDMKTGHLLSDHVSHEMQVTSAAFSDDGKWLATGDAGNQLFLREASNGNRVLPPMRHSGWVVAIDFSPDGKWLATGGTDNCIKLWNIERCLNAKSNKENVPLEQCEPETVLRHRGQVRAVRFSPNGDSLLSLVGDKTARIWDTQTGLERCPPLVHRGVPTFGFFRGSGAYVITGSTDNVIRTWDANTGESVNRDIVLASGLKDLDLDPGGNQLASLEQDGRVVLWDLGDSNSSSVELLHKEIVYSLEFGPNGLLACGTAGQADTVTLWNTMETNPTSSTLNVPGYTFDLAFVPGKNTLVTGGTQSWLKIWNTSDRTIEPVGISGESPITGVAVSHDGKFVARTAWDGFVRVFALSTEKEIGAPRKQTGVRTVAFHPHRLEFATGGSDGIVRIWRSLESTTPDLTIPHTSAVRDVTFSRDGKLIATASQDRLVRLFDVTTGEIVGTPLSHDGAVNAMHFSPDGQLLITGAEDGMARLWDVVRRKEIAAPMRHAAPVLAVAFHANGSTLATGSSDKTVRLWQVPQPVALPKTELRRFIEQQTGIQLDSTSSLHSLNAVD